MSRRPRRHHRRDSPAFQRPCCFNRLASATLRVSETVAEATPRPCVVAHGCVSEASYRRPERIRRDAIGTATELHRAPLLRFGVPSAHAGQHPAEPGQPTRILSRFDVRWSGRPGRVGIDRRFPRPCRASASLRYCNMRAIDRDDRPNDSPMRASGVLNGIVLDSMRAGCRRVGRSR